MDSYWDAKGLAEHIDRSWTSDAETSARYSEVRALMPYLRYGDILEIGCGSGRIYETLRAAGILQKGRRYVGVDSSREMLKIAISRFPETTFLERDAMDLGDLSAPNVICIHVLQHVEDYTLILRELWRVSTNLVYIASWFGPETLITKTEYGYWDNVISVSEIVAEIRRLGPSRIVRTPTGALAVSK